MTTRNPKLSSRAWLCALLLGGGAPALAIEPATLGKIDALFLQWGANTPGCALGISHEGKNTLKAYGAADLERGVAMTPDTIVETGSAAKQFTAAAVLLLVRDGKLSLDDPVRKFIPELPDYGAPMTIRHALQHTAGLRDWGSLVAFEGWPRGERNFTNAHAVALLSQQRKLNFTPGSAWSYSNSGYILAAEIVERVSGRTFAKFSEQRLFKPLGMKDTRWREDITTLVKRRSLAYAPARGGQRPGADGASYRLDMPNDSVHGAGGLMTTVEDLLKWSAALNEVGFFDAAFLRTMHEPVALTGGTRFPAYSLGLEHRQWVGAREVHHAGATAGYRAQVSSFPDQKLNIALLCNGSNTAPAAAVRKIAGLVLGRVLEAEGVPTQTSRLSESELNAFVGVYRDPRGVGSRRIVLDDKTPPGLRVFDGPTLLAQSATTLMLGDGSRFELTPKGLVLSTPRGVAQQWDRVAEVSPSAEQLKAYEGEYRSDEARASYRVAVESGRLTLKRAPYFVARLTAQFADGFESPFASVVFQRDANGKVVSMSMGDARVWNLSFLRVD